MLADKEIELLDRIKRKKVYEDKFFEKQSDPKWFDELKKRGYFNPNIDTSPQVSKEKGYFSIPQWNVLPYLEKVSQQVNIPKNEKYIDELLTIIKDATKYHVEHNRVLDNYRTWWYFVKILLNIPNDKIPDEIIDLIPVWLETKFDTTLQGADIATKLLPKFLPDNPMQDDIKKAEKIVDIVTQIKWVSRYTPQQKEEIKQKYKHIFDKPEQERTEEEKLEIAFFDLDEKEAKTIIDTHWFLKSFISQKNAVKIGEKCSENVIFGLANKLKEIFTHENREISSDLSYIWFKSLFDVSGHISGTEETLTLILRDIILAKARKDEKTTKNIFEKFLGYPLFKRLVLFVVGSEWNKYKDIFWKMLDEDKEHDLFNDPHYEPEVYKILENNIKHFLPEEKEEIKKTIEEKVPRKPHPEEKYREYYAAYQKQEWYSAVKTDPFFAPLYEEQKRITQTEEEISFRKSEVRSGPGPSPLSKEDILIMPNKELAKYLKEFKTVDWWKGPTIGGLSDTLKNIVEEQPEKFIDDLKPFLKTGYLYVYDIFWGIRDAWEKKKLIDWKKVFDFIQKYVTPKDFWDDKYKIEGDDWKASHLWVTGMVGELIRVGCKNGDWTFSEDYFDVAKEILFLILEKQQIQEKEEIRDYVTHALNTPFGKVIEALIYLALRIARVEDKKEPKKEVKWSSEFRDKYNNILTREIIEGYTLLGRYLPNLYCLDKNWAEEKIKVTAPTENKSVWEAFMEGYLLGGEVYDNLYKLMRSHYLVAIDYEFKEKHAEELLVQHICIEYLRGIEDINDTKSLFRILLDRWNPSQVNEIIGFFWMQRRDYERVPDKSVVLEYKDGETKPKVIEHKQEQEQPIEDKERLIIENKIIDFWQWVYENKYKGKQDGESNNEDKKILSELCNLTVFLPEINSENFEWLKISALFVDVSFHSSFFIEYLDELKDKGQSINFIGKIYKEMLKNTTPDFDKEHIRSIVEYLYQNGKKIEANEICNTYGSRGLEFLRDLYDKYNPK